MADNWKTYPVFLELQKECPEFANCLERDRLLDADHPGSTGVSMRQHFLDALKRARTADGSKTLVSLVKALQADPVYCTMGPSCDWVAKQSVLGRVVGKVPFDQQLTNALMSASGSMHPKVIDKRAAEASNALILKQDVEKFKEVAHILQKARIRKTRAPVTTMGGNPSWSFRMSVKRVQNLTHAQQEMLPCQLALPHHKLHEVANGVSGPWIAYSHTKKKGVGYRLPTTLDASILSDNSVVFAPGGKTMPFGHCASQPGLEEVVHEPNTFYDIVGITDNPDVVGFKSRIG